MKILSNCTLEKLKEYSQSYGAAEIIQVPYIKVFDKEIHLYNSSGNCYRVLRKNTKLLIDYNGTEITERQFNLRTKKYCKLLEIEKQKREEKEKAEKERINTIASEQLSKWVNWLFAHPEKKEKYKEKAKLMNSKKFENLMALKCCQKINDEKFSTLFVHRGDIVKALFNNI